MKVLRFLINSYDNLLFQNLVGYLIDAGHLVFICSTNEEIKAKLNTKYKHNLYPATSIKQQAFDYIIDLDSGTLKNKAPQIGFNLKLTNDSITASVFLKQENRTGVICSKVIKLGDLHSSLEKNLEYLNYELTEVFIDSIVHLLRFGKEGVQFNDNIQSTLPELSAYKQCLDKLNTYYKSLEDKEDLFFIQDLVALATEEITYVQSELSNNRCANLSKTDLELLALYLLNLLNSRKDGTYGYDLYFLKHSPVKPISKFIDVRLTDSYHNLSEKFNNGLYDIASNSFYYGIPLYNNNIKPKVAIFYNVSKPSHDEYLLSLNYHDNILTIRYRKDLYFFEDIEQYIANFLDKLNQFKSAAVNFKELLDLPQDYLNKYLVDWNATDREFPQDKTIHQLFEEQVARTPNNIALVFEETKLTYQELNKKANRLAYYIKQVCDISPDTLIVLCLDRSEYMLISILAVLKAGGAYVPVDPNYPDDRIQYLLEDTGTRLVLTNGSYEKRLQNLTNQSDLQIIGIDSNGTQNQLLLHTTDNLKITTESTDLAYVIYTSGTTGKPKGVMIEHKGVVNLAAAEGRELELDNSRNIKNWLWYANYVFDAHIWEVYSAILRGCTIHIIDNTTRHDINLLASYIQKHYIDIALIPPILLNNKILLKLKKLVVGGDKTDQAIIDYYLNNNIKVINAYGPTEVTVMSNTYTFIRKAKATNIGSPISNSKCYVLDVNLRPLPIGTIGELHIGGVGLARGYLDRPDLTAEKFIDNPFQTEEEKKFAKNAKLYKTGDLVQWLPDGNLEYIGRNDFQVKIRGHRIELGEIEAILKKFPNIKEAVTVVKEKDNNKYIISYYTCYSEINKEELYKYFADKLPEYMIPNGLVLLDEIPITTNGKIDKKGLPECDFVDADLYMPPRNFLERKVIQIWSEIFNIPENLIGINKDFFRLGGNSISGIQVVNRMRKDLGLSIKIKDMFLSGTIEKLFDNIISPLLLEGDLN